MAIEYMSAVRYLCDAKDCDTVLTSDDHWCSEDDIAERGPNQATAYSLSKWRTVVTFIGVINPLEDALPHATDLKIFCSAECARDKDDDRA